MDPRCGPLRHLIPFEFGMSSYVQFESKTLVKTAVGASVVGAAVGVCVVGACSNKKGDFFTVGLGDTGLE